MSDSSAATDVSFVPVKRVRAFEGIAKQIREQLHQGNFLPGQKLPSERELCEKFQVSRNTLREAIRSLENAGVLQSRKGSRGGTFVVRANGAAVVTGLSDMYQMRSIKPVELTEARIWIESAVIRAAAGFITAEEIDALDRNINEAEAASKAGEFELRVQLNLDFHRMLAKATRNGVMVTMMEALLQATHHIIQKVGPYDNRFVPRSRRRFLNFLRKGDAESAVLEMERQLNRMQRIYFNKIESL